MIYNCISKNEQTTSIGKPKSPPAEYIKNLQRLYSFSHFLNKKLHDISRFLPVFLFSLPSPKFILGRVGVGFFKGLFNYICISILQQSNHLCQQADISASGEHKEFCSFCTIFVFFSTKNFTIFHDFCLFFYFVET